MLNAIVYFLLVCWKKGEFEPSNMKDNDISKTIRKLRTELGLTQEQFAAKVGVTFSTVNRWENGRGKPSPLAMKRIKHLLARNKKMK